jgi:hypothetical protein
VANDQTFFEHARAEGFKGFSLVAVIVTLIGLLFGSSAVTVSLLNNAIETAASRAGPTEYLTLFKVVISALPLVIAGLITPALLAELKKNALWAFVQFAVLWSIAAFVVTFQAPETIRIQMNQGPDITPVRLLIWSFNVFTHAYGWILIVQAFVVVAGGYLVPLWVQYSWRKKQRATESAPVSGDRPDGEGCAD